MGGSQESVSTRKFSTSLKKKKSSFCIMVLQGNSLEGRVLVLMAAAAKSLQSCPTLCDPIDGSLPGSSVPGILQARILEWVAISFSNARKWKSESEGSQLCPTLRDPMGCSLPGSSIHGIFQAGVLEWAAISFSRGSSQPRDWMRVSCIGKRILYHCITWPILIIST